MERQNEEVISETAANELKTKIVEAVTDAVLKKYGLTREPWVQSFEKGLVAGTSIGMTLGKAGMAYTEEKEAELIEYYKELWSY